MYRCLVLFVKLLKKTESISFTTAVCRVLITNLPLKKNCLWKRWKWQHGTDNLEATRCKSGENLKWKYKNYKTVISIPQRLAVRSVRIWQHSPPFRFNTTTWKQQLGRDKVEVTTWKRQHVTLIGFHTSWVLQFLMELQKHKFWIL